MPKSMRIGFAPLICLALTSMSCMWPGQRLLTFEIESAGTVVYEGNTSVPDPVTVPKMWDALGDVVFQPVGSERDISEDEGINTRTLPGPIVVRIKHVDQELAKVSLDDLTLQFDDEAETWSIDAGEMVRIKATAEQ